MRGRGSPGRWVGKKMRSNDGGVGRSHLEEEDLRGGGWGRRYAVTTGR